MKLKIAFIALGCSLAALSGCTSSKSSPERHAYYFVSHRSDFVGGNFVSNRQENYRLNLPNFTDIYARGQQDRKSGMSESDARNAHRAFGLSFHLHPALLLMAFHYRRNDVHHIRPLVERGETP